MQQYDQLPPHARLWIYGADRPLSTDAADEHLKTELEHFADQWTSHTRALSAFAGIWLNRFIVFGIDEQVAAASGCSIDSQVHFVKALGAKHNIDFFDRMRFYVTPDRLEIVSYSAEEFATAYAQGEIDDTSLVADPLVSNKAAAEHEFIKPLAASWHKRFV